MDGPRTSLCHDSLRAMRAKIYKNEDKLPNACADSLITLWHVIAVDENLKEELILN